MKLSERIFISLILAILIFFISLVDINFESHLMISSFAQKEREIIFENYDTRIVSYVDNMTDQKVEYLVLLFDSPIYMAIFRHNDFSIGFYSNYEYLHFSPDATHLIRVGDSTPIPLNYIDKANCLKPKTPEMGDLVISALVKGEEISLRYYMDTQIPVFESPVKQYEQIDTKFQNIFFGFVYHKAATLFGWKDLETSPDLPPVKLNILTPTDPESKVEVTVTIQGNPSILLTKNKERSYASIKVGGREALRFNSNSECVYIDNYMPDYLIIRDLDGKTVFKERLPIGSYIEKPTSYTMLAFGDTRWSEGETAVKKAWETGSLGFIEIEGRKGSLYGFRELWQWGVDNLNFPSIGVDIQAEPVISPGPSLQATDTTKPPQDVLPGRIVWDRTYGGSGYDEAWSLIQTTDGGYAVAGYTSSKGAGGYDAWVIRLDQEGNKVWDKTYGGSQDDGAWSLIQTTDGGYAVAGYTSSKGAGGRDFWVIKLDSQGNIVWDRTYGGRRDDLANSIIQTTDGGFVVAGFTCSKGAGRADAWIIKLDSEGNKKWEKTYGGSMADSINSLIQTIDGGFVVAGFTYSKGAGNSDVWIFKLDRWGNLTPNSEALEVEAEVDATESQLSLTTHPLQGSLHCPDKTGYACLSCLEASGYVNHFKGFNILTTQEDCYVRLVTKDNSSIENHNDCEVIIKGEKWLGLEDESETVLVEEINKGNFEFIPANLFAERTITFPQDGYQYEFADGGKEFRLYLSRNLTEAFKAVPWQNLSVEIKNQETNKVFTYQFEKGIFPRPYTWSTGVANYGQCVWWAANRWVEEVDSQSLFPFYPPPSSDMKGVKSIDSNYQPKQYDIFIDYNPEQASKLGHYAFVEKVEDDLVYITQFNFIPPGEVYNSISRFWSGNPKSLYYSLNPNNEYYFKYYYRD